MRRDPEAYRPHKLFWTGPRRRRLAKIAQLVLQATELEVSDIGARLGLNKDEVKTLKRYLDPFHWSGQVERKPQLLDLLTGATRALYEVLSEDTQGRWNCESEKDGLEALLSEMPPSISDQAIGNGIGRCDRGFLEKIVRTIPRPSNSSHAASPEFPHHSPRFPATGEAKLDLGAFEIQIKDESRNPTGSHKDRWAWEKLLRYRDRIEQELERAPATSKKITIPVLAMISAGSAAMALQSLLRLYGLPSLRVVLDKNRGRTPQALIDKLEAIGAKIELIDLDEQELSSDRLLEIFGCNPLFDIDVTSRDADSPFEQSYYDWLTYEILAMQPDYIFVPVGSGDLFANIIRIIESETSHDTVPHDRLKDAREDLTGIHVLGAKPSIQKTRMTKLWAKFTPSHPQIEDKVKELIEKEKLGAHSGLYELEDKFALDAFDKTRVIHLNTEYSGIAGLGLFLKLKDRLPIPEGSNIVVVNTGWLNLMR